MLPLKIMAVTFIIRLGVSNNRINQYMAKAKIIYHLSKRVALHIADVRELPKRWLRVHPNLVVHDMYNIRTMSEFHSF